MSIDDWNKLVIKGGCDFLQSWEWGEFQKSLGKKVERVKSDTFVAQIIFNTLPFGLGYGYIPRGPVPIGEEIKETDFLDALKSYKKPSTVFLEADLLSEASAFSSILPETRQPRQTTILNLGSEEKQILKGFHKNHRYSIRKSKENNLSFRVGDNWQNLFAILSETAKIQNFRIWPRHYYEKLVADLVPAGMIEIISAYSKDLLVASNLYIVFGGRAVHLFGGSDDEKRDLMAPHALHWHAIQEFKKRGIAEYDFWGVDDKKWPGLTRFKERFGGERVIYPGSYKKVLRPVAYTAYKVVRAMKRQG